MSLSEQLGLLGRKVGMMRIFTDDGDTIPVTVLDVSNNRVTQVKTAATDGYNALQVAFGARKASRVNKPAAGHLAKAGVEAGEVLKEFRVSAETAGQYAPGAVLPVSVFAGEMSLSLAVMLQSFEQLASSLTFLATLTFGLPSGVATLTRSGVAASALPPSIIEKSTPVTSSPVIRFMSIP